MHTKINWLTARPIGSLSRGTCSLPGRYKSEISAINVGQGEFKIRTINKLDKHLKGIMRVIN
jgi:hypothetical protein